MKYPCIRNLNRINALLIVIAFITGILMRAYSDNNRKEVYKPEEDYEWALYLIDSEHPLPASFSAELKEVDRTFMLDARCADYAKAMIEAAEKDGVDLIVVSAYRSVEKQAENFKIYNDTLIKKGFSPSEAYKKTAAEIAMPGASEHNAGLALDILTEDWWETHDDITDDFENTEEFIWLWENAWKYGFILRYPKNYENVTGFSYEPWHYRFVGTYHAEMIYRSGVCLEDYIADKK